jgi:hypothetical protein
MGLESIAPNETAYLSFWKSTFALDRLKFGIAMEEYGALNSHQHHLHFDFGAALIVDAALTGPDFGIHS